MSMARYQKARTLFAAGFIFFLAQSASAQLVLSQSEQLRHRQYFSKNIDSLKKELTRAHHDTARVQIYLELSSNVHSNGNIDSAFQLVEQAHELAQKADHVPS